MLRHRQLLGSASCSHRIHLHFYAIKDLAFLSCSKESVQNELMIT